MLDFTRAQQTLIAVFCLVLIVVGMAVVGGAKKQDYAQTARVGFNVIVGIIIAALGLVGISFAMFGKQLLNLVGIQV